MTPAVGNFQFPDTTIHRVLDSLLSKGLCSGTGDATEIGHYCIVQAINLAENGLTPSKGIRTITDEATCVAERARRFAIRLNDRSWSSNESRAEGMRALGHALIGSAGIDEQAWADQLGRRYIVKALPEILTALSKLKYYAPDAESLLAAARRCQEEGTRDAARFARDVVYAARRAAAARPNPYKAEAEAEAVAVAEAVAAAVAAAKAAAGKPWSQKVYDAYWDTYWKVRNGGGGDELLTRVANIAAEELEIAKAARDAQQVQA